MMHVLILNLARETARKKWMCKEFKDFNPIFLVSKKDRENPERGCANAHIRAWNYIINQGLKQAVVLEDDAKLLGGMCLIPEKIKGDILFLHDKVFCDFETKKFMGGHSTTGYVITEKGCRIALKAMQPFTKAIDIQWFQRGLEHSMIDTTGLPALDEKSIAYCMDPPVITNNKDLKSTIKGD